MLKPPQSDYILSRLDLLLVSAAAAEFLIFHGRRYPLSIGGVGIGSLGVAAVDLVGTAYNLHRPADIAGSYGAAGAGATFIGGGQVAQLQNGNGVILQLAGVQAGFQVSLGLAGMTIALR